MTQLDPENFMCSISMEILDDPVCCVKCINNFCKKCAKQLKQCPFCKASPFVYEENRQLKRLLSNLTFVCPNNCGKVFKTEKERDDHVLNCDFSPFQCSFCDKLLKSEDLFWIHLIDEHKATIIQTHNKKDSHYKEDNKTVEESHSVISQNAIQQNDDELYMKSNTISVNNHKRTYNNVNTPIGNNNPQLSNPFCNNNSNQISMTQMPSNNIPNLNNDLPSFDAIDHCNTVRQMPPNQMSNKIDINYYPSYDLLLKEKPKTNPSMNNNNSNMLRKVNTINTFKGNSNPQSYQTKFDSTPLSIPQGAYQGQNSMVYCNKPTYLNCGCCQGICCEGQCLCQKCMALNCKIRGLRPGQLINRKGRVAIYSGGVFSCGDRFYYKYKNVYGIEFQKMLTCGEGGSVCDACVPLKKLMNIYLQNKK